MASQQVKAGGKRQRFSPTYTKLLQDGTPDSNPLEQSNYDAVVNFIKSSFPKTLKVQKELETTMKRTFILGRTDVKSQQNRRKKKKLNISIRKQGSNRKRKLEQKLRSSKAVPRKLLYKDFIELHSLWKSYISDILKYDTHPSDIQAKLNRVDLHGALIKVVNSKCDSYINLKGIVVKETKNTFVIVTEEDETKTLPKHDSTFHVVLKDPDGVMEIAGNSFLTRPAERATKKAPKAFMDFVGFKIYRRAILTLK